jgi:hypothetical protein
MVQQTAEHGAILPVIQTEKSNRASIMITTFTYPNLRQNKQFCFTPALFVTVLPSDASFVRLEFANFGSTNARNNQQTLASVFSQTPKARYTPNLRPFRNKKNHSFAHQAAATRTQAVFMRETLTLRRAVFREVDPVGARVARILRILHSVHRECNGGSNEGRTCGLTSASSALTADK